MRRLMLLTLLLAGCDDATSSSAQTRPNTMAAPVAATVPSAPTTHPVARAWGRELHVAETNTWPLPKSAEFSLKGIWRYDPDADRWARVLKVSVPLSAKIDPVRPTPGAGAPSRRILEMPEQIGLYWVTWSEDGRDDGSMVFNGPILCNDIEIGEPPPGKVTACVPFENLARAQFVPDPKLHCR